MSEYKAYKFLIKPTKEQISFFKDHFEVNRYLYNTMLRTSLEKYNSESDQFFLESLNKPEIIEQIEHLKQSNAPQKDWYKFINMAKKGGKPASVFDLQKLVTALVADPDVPWVSTYYDADAMRQVSVDVQKSFESIFKGNQPRFKKRNQIKSVTFRGKTTKTKNGTRDSIEAYQDQNQIKLPTVKLINAVIHRPVLGTIKLATVSQAPTGKWYISLISKYDGEVQLPKHDKLVAFDQGLTTFLTGALDTESNTIIKYESPRFFSPENKKGNQQSLIEKLTRAQKRLSRKYEIAKKQRLDGLQEKKLAIKNNDTLAEIAAIKKIEDSYLCNRSNYQKDRIQVAKLQTKIANQRAAFLHNLSKQLVSEYDTIIIEGFSIQDLVQNIKSDTTISTKQKTNTIKKIHDLAWYDFRVKLDYKCQMYGKKLIILPSDFDANKKCHHCQTTFDVAIPYTQYEFTCPNCQLTFNRAENSAKNILKEGLAIKRHLDLVQTATQDIKTINPKLNVAYNTKTQTWLIKEVISEKNGIQKEFAQKLIEIKKGKLKEFKITANNCQTTNADLLKIKELLKEFITS